MNTIELRTSITADLELMNTEMLESVSRYVRRLRHYSRNKRTKAISKQSDWAAAMLFVQGLSAHGGQQVPANERGTEALLSEKYDMQ